MGLHEEINEIGKQEVGPIEIPGLKKVDETTKDNSQKLDELLKVVHNITADSVSSEALENLRRQLKEAESTIASLQRENRRLGEHDKAATAKIRDLTERIKVLEKALHDRTKYCQETIDQLQVELSSLKESLAGYKDRTAKLEE